MSPTDSRMAYLGVLVLAAALAAMGCDQVRVTELHGQAAWTYCRSHAPELVKEWDAIESESKRQAFGMLRLAYPSGRTLTCYGLWEREAGEDITGFELPIVLEDGRVIGRFTENWRRLPDQHPWGRAFPRLLVDFRKREPGLVWSRSGYVGEKPEVMVRRLAPRKEDLLVLSIPQEGTRRKRQFKTYVNLEARCRNDRSEAYINIRCFCDAFGHVCLEGTTFDLDFTPDGRLDTSPIAKPLRVHSRP